MAGSGEPASEADAAAPDTGERAVLTVGAARIGDPRRARDLSPLAAVLVGLAALAVYRTTLLPGLGYWDTAEAQTVLPLLGTMHPTGFPAFVVLGWLFTLVTGPLGQPAFLTNLFAATCTALAAAGAVLVMRRLAVPLPVAIAAGIGFALTPLVWHISNSADAHALHVALLTALTLALLRWKALVDARRAHPGDAAYRRRGDRAIVLAAAIYGVAAANHGLSLILAPSIVLFVLAVEPGVLGRPKLILAAIGTAIGVAGLFYLELPLRAGLIPAPIGYAHPDTWSGFWDVVLAKQFQGDVQGVLSDLPGKAAALLQLADDQYGPLVAILPAALLVAAVRHPKYTLFSGTAALVTVAFAISYANADISRYYLGPVFFGWTWLAILAAAFVDAIGSWLRGGESEGDWDPSSMRRARLGVAVALAAALLIPTTAQFNARWTANNVSGDTQAEDWLDSAFGSMAPNAVVVSWWSYSTPMWYGQDIEHRRPDVLIVDDSNIAWDHLGTVPDVIDRYLGSRPVYVIRESGSDVQNLAQRYAIQPVGRPGNLFLVTGRRGTTP